MSIFLAGSSALEYLSHQGRSIDRASAKAHAWAFRRGIPADAEVRDALQGRLLGLQTPLHLLVSVPERRRVTHNARCRCWSGALPSKAFFQLDRQGSHFASTPEFALVHMARELSLVRLTMALYEACGTYRVSPRDVTRGFVDSPSLTTPDRLSHIIGEIREFEGSQRMRRALRFIAAGSASPRETALVMLLCLPRSLGGYGLALPQLNPVLTPPAHLARRLSQRHYVPDLYWPQARLDVEYDSDLEHTGPNRIARDSRRRAELNALGIEVVTITNEQLKSPRQMDEVARVIARRLGSRLRLERVADWGLRNDRLRRQLVFPEFPAPMATF